MIENQLANSRVVIPVGPGKIYDVDVQDLLQVVVVLLLLLRHLIAHQPSPGPILLLMDRHWLRHHRACRVRGDLHRVSHRCAAFKSLSPF
jgi:hypothetical protein